MRVKCHGFEGTLLYLEAREDLARHADGSARYVVHSYDIDLRLDTGEKMSIDGVSSSEIEVTDG